MNTKELYEKMLGARRPIDFFGAVNDVDALKAVFRMFAKMVHPDTAKDKYVTTEAFKELNVLYSRAKQELQDGVYASASPIDSTIRDSLLEVDIRGVLYKFYEHVFEGEVADIFKGGCNSDTVFLKMAIDSKDNDLIANEFEVLSTIRHGSLPFVDEKIEVNGASAIIMREVVGVDMPQLMKGYPHGVPAKHVAWMMERLFSVVGYLHSNLVVHGNIKPEQLIINKDNHNVTLCGFSMCIQKANTRNAKYKIQNEHYTAPEVDTTATVLPVSDIFSLGKVFIEMLGGNIETNTLPDSVDSRMVEFIHHLVEPDYQDRPNDAWRLWDELRQLRSDIFGSKRFEKLD